MSDWTVAWLVSFPITWWLMEDLMLDKWGSVYRVDRGFALFFACGGPFSVLPMLVLWVSTKISKLRRSDQPIRVRDLGQ